MELASNKLKFDISNSSEKYLLYMQNVAWIWSSCLIVALKDYASNPIFQKLPNKKNLLRLDGQKNVQKSR